MILCKATTIIFDTEQTRTVVALLETDAAFAHGTDEKTSTTTKTEGEAPALGDIKLVVVGLRDTDCEGGRPIGEVSPVAMQDAVKAAMHLGMPCSRLEVDARGVRNWEREAAGPTAADLAATRANVRITDTLFHIFTSGTTGLPKAARIHHLKLIGSGVAIAKFYNIRPTDVRQNCYSSTLSRRRRTVVRSHNLTVSTREYIFKYSKRSLFFRCARDSG